MTNSEYQVEILTYDPQWVARFRQEADLLRSTLGEQIVAIHHIGSTSVPGLQAKPIIDVLLEVRDIEELDRHNQAMREQGYDPRGEFGLPRRRYFPRSADGQRASHVHSWQTGDTEIRRHLDFRDYLISHPQAREAYGDLKADLADKFAGDRDSYVEGKHSFCQETERQAVAWGSAIRTQALETDRLTLLPLNPAQLNHYLNRPRQLEAALHFDLSESILTDPVHRAIRTKLHNTAGGNLQKLLWNTYWLAVIREQGFGAGLIGFKGAPRKDGMVEIGYGIDATVRRQGYTTEAGAALVNWALTQPECYAVVACTEKSNIASIRVLEKLGFSLARETDEEFSWITANPVSH